MVNLTGMLPPALGGEQEAPPPPSYEPEMDLNKTQQFSGAIKGEIGLSDELMEEVEDYLKNPPPKPKQSPIDAAIDAGYLIAKKISKDKTKYLSGIAEYNPEGNKAIRGMFKNALGADPDWNPTEVAWCATFVSQVLSDLGADPLRSKDRYDRVRADKYKNYGSPVDIGNITEGDIVVLDFDGDGRGDHATFYVGDKDDINNNPDSPYISVLGGNQGDAVNIRDYAKENILAIRRITYNDIDYEFTKELARDNADFNAFLKKEGEGFDMKSLEENPMSPSNTPMTSRPEGFDEGGLAENKNLDLARSYGVTVVDPKETDQTLKAFGKAAVESIPGISTAATIRDIKEELQEEDPSWGKIGLLAAGEVVGMVPGLGDAAQNMVRQGVKRFKTGRGSTYKVEEGSRTTRERAPDEVGGEVVTQPTSGKTIYMSYDDMERFGLLFQKGEPGLYQFVPIEGQKGKAHLTFAKDYGPNKKGDPVPNTEVSFTTEPKVGDHPVEIYESTNNNRVSIHFGSEITEVMDDSDIWSYPEQLYDSAETSINVSKKPAGYNELKKRGEIKDGDLIVDIGGGKFDNLVDDAAEQGATVKVYDPFNRSPEHNKDVVDSVRDGKADMAMSHNVLNVIQEDKNIIDIARQAENAVKPGGKAHFSVYEGTGKGEGKVTTKGYQRNQKTQDYIPLIEEVFGKGNVTRKGKIITATKKETQGFNQGGPVMNEQMEMAFMQEGGIKDDGMKRDPVSGNEIPPGSMASEVRDDIPAMLSEGEYVVPADVLRFYGVNFFENLRNKAKSGLQTMEQNGRIGGEPLSPNQVQQNMSGKPQAGAPARMPVAANTGPYIAGQPNGLNQAQQMSQNFNPMNYGVVGGSTLGGGQQQESVTTFKTYVNAETGETKVLEYINGQLKNKSDEQYTVPPYYLFGSAALKKAQQAASQPTPSSGDGGGDPPTPPEPKDPNEWAKDITNPEAWADENLQGKANSVIDTIQLGTSVARVNAMAIVAEAQGNTELANTLRGKARDFVAKNPVLNSLPNAWIDGDKIAEDLQKDKDRAKNLFGMKTEEQKKFAARAEQRKAEQRAKATEQAKADKAAAAAALKAAQSSQDDDDPFKVTDVDIDRDPMGQMTQTTTYEGIDPGLTTADEDGLYKGGLMARKKAKKK